MIFLNAFDRTENINRQQLPKNKKVAKIVVNIERTVFSENKTPRNVINIQNGKIITVEIGLADFTEILPLE